MAHSLANFQLTPTNFSLTLGSNSYDSSSPNRVSGGFCLALVLVRRGDCGLQLAYDKSCSSQICKFQSMKRGSAIAGSAIFLVIAPGTVMVLVPWWISRWH